MDPGLTKKFLEEGIMPSVKTLLERGVAREDLIMQGGHPTITPPMWTTMATGTCPGTHGTSPVSGIRTMKIWIPLYIHWIPCKCKSEPLWNCEAGQKTLVWH